MFHETRAALCFRAKTYALTDYPKFCIGLAVVRTDGRSLGRSVARSLGHVITKFSGMGRFIYPWCSAGALRARSSAKKTRKGGKRTSKDIKGQVKGHGRTSKDIKGQVRTKKDK